MKTKKLLTTVASLIFSTVLHADSLQLTGQRSPNNPLRKQVLYAPYREKYMNNTFKKKPIANSNKPKKCVFCADIQEQNDEQHLMPTRFKHNVIFLNIFPYQRGHVLILPNEHVKNLEELSFEARHELIEIIAAIPGIFEMVLGASGTNIGINVGKIAGASKPDHVHIHALPRYGNDHLGFIQLLGETKVIQWDLKKLYHDLKPAFDDLKKKLCRDCFDIQDYYESGMHDQEMQSVLDHAWKKLETIRPSENSLVIIDIDETALSNYEYFKKNNWQKDSEQNFANWKATKQATAIAPMLAFYKKLVSHGFKIMFISSRGQELQQKTHEHLVEQGYDIFEDILLRSPEKQKQLFSANAFSSFKTKKRNELIKQGYEIVACVGDQWSDLQGNNTGLKIKVPTFFE